MSQVGYGRQWPPERGGTKSKDATSLIEETDSCCPCRHVARRSDTDIKDKEEKAPRRARAIFSLRMLSIEMFETALVASGDVVSG